MMGIVQSDGYDNMSYTDVGPFSERFLNPELLEFNFTTFLGILFPFTTFFVFFLIVIFIY